MQDNAANWASKAFAELVDVWLRSLVDQIGTPLYRPTDWAYPANEPIARRTRDRPGRSSEVLGRVFAPDIHIGEGELSPR